MKYNIIVFGTAVIFVALSPFTANATEPPPNQSYDEKAISSLTTKSELPVEPLRSTSGTYEAEAGLVAVSIPKDPQKPVVISKQNESSAAFIKTSTSSIDMKQYVENSTVVNQGMNMSIGSQAIDGGIQQIAYIKKDVNSHILSVHYATQGSTHLAYARDAKGRTDGSVALFKDTAENEPLLFMPLPSVKDTKGKSLSSHYKIEGDNLVQVIDRTADIQFPIVSTYASIVTFFSSNNWIYRSPMWSLSLVPNGWFRVAGGLNGVAEEIVNRQAWNAIYAQHHANSHWRDRNVNGMFNQYECHFHFAFWKSAFNLEPNRPNPGFNTYLTKLCNP